MKVNATTLMVVYVVCMSAVNIILDRYLKPYSIEALLVVWEFIILIISIVVFLYSKSVSNEPVVYIGLGFPFIMLLIASLSYYIADYCYLTAFHENGNIVTIVCMIIAIPIAVSAIKALITGELSSWRHYLAFAVMSAAIAIFYWAESFTQTVEQ